MSGNTFEIQLYDSNRPLISAEWHKVLLQIFGKDAKIEWHPKSKIAQLGIGIDAIVTDKTGRKHLVDVKTRRRKYFENPTYLLELQVLYYATRAKVNKVGHKAGWLYSSGATHVVMGTITEDKNTILEVCCFTIQELSAPSFASNISQLRTTMVEGDYQDSGRGSWTVNAMIHKDLLESYVKVFKYFKT